MRSAEESDQGDGKSWDLALVSPQRRVSREKTPVCPAIVKRKHKALSLSRGKKRWQKERAGDWADRLIGRGVGLAHHPEGDRRHRFLFLVRVDDGRFGALDREEWAESRTDVLL